MMMSELHGTRQRPGAKHSQLPLSPSLPLPPKLPLLPAGPPQSLILLLDEARNQAGNQHAIRQAISMQAGGAISMQSGGAISMQWGQWRRGGA